jgi:hypothetical protein
MKVLIACEYSGAVRDQFIKLGHDAMSCDLLPTDAPGPHYQGDVFDIINDGWDMMIAHPPCTFLSKAGARWLYPTAGNLDQTRFLQGMNAKEFFIKLFNAPIKFICLENPTPLKIFKLPEPSQVIQPFEFGHPYSKRTLLWLKNLPQLQTTKKINNYTPFLPSNTGGAKRNQKHSRGTAKNWKEASTTFEGVAKAMAEQWSQPQTVQTKLF